MDPMIGYVLLMNILIVLAFGVYDYNVWKDMKQKKKGPRRVNAFDGISGLGIIWFTLGFAFKNSEVWQVGLIFLLVGLGGNKLKKRISTLFRL